MARLLLRADTTFAVILVLFAIQAVIRFGGHLNPDVGWYLYAGGRLLDGATLYRDIVEVNPPLALWLCAGIVAVGRAVGIDAAFLFNTIVFALTAGSLALSALFISAATEVTATTRHILLILAAALVLFVPAEAFGQRDHIAILVSLPWVLLRWNRLLGREVPWILAALVGALAAVGLWLKPHFVFLLIAVEVTMLLTGRDMRAVFRVETLTIVVFGIVYMAAIRLIWSPALLTTVALLGSRAYIPIYGVAVEQAALQLSLPLVLAVIAAASSSLLTEQLNLLRTLLFVVGASYACIYILQAGHPFQVMPALCFLSLAAGLGLARVIAGEVTYHNKRERLAAVAAAPAILAVFVSALSSQRSEYSGQQFADAIAAEAPGARTIFIASTEAAHPFPLVNEQGFVWASRFSTLWLSPYVATKLDDEGGPGDDIARFELEATVSDLIDFQPDVVFVDEARERPHFEGPPLDYVGFWRKDYRFPRFWEAYERRGMVGSFAIFVRNDPPSN